MARNKTAAGLLSGLMFLTLSVNLFAADEITYEAGKRRDPFVPLNPEDRDLTSSSSIKLEGIIYDPSGRSLVILNGKTYQAGETAGSAKILRILKDRVVLSEEGEEKTLRIREEEKA